MRAGEHSSLKCSPIGRRPMIRVQSEFDIHFRVRRQDDWTTRRMGVFLQTTYTALTAAAFDLIACRGSERSLRRNCSGHTSLQKGM